MYVAFYYEVTHWESLRRFNAAQLIPPSNKNLSFHTTKFHFYTKHIESDTQTQTRNLQTLHIFMLYPRTYFKLNTRLEWKSFSRNLLTHRNFVLDTNTHFKFNMTLKQQSHSNQHINITMLIFYTRTYWKLNTTLQQIFFQETC